MENKNTESLVEIKREENENKEKNSLKKKTNLDFWFGVSLPGRILMTLYSLHGLFFIYNLVISYIIFIPSILNVIEKYSKAAVFVFGIMYIAFALYSSNILIIPTFEFFSFPFLLYREPLAHIYSLIYIFKDIKYTVKDAENEHNIFAIVFFIIIEITYFIGFVFGLGLTPKLDGFKNFKDIVKVIMLSCVLIYYIIIILEYTIYSFYLIFIFFLGQLCDEKCLRNAINSNFKDKEISNLNLFSHLINPYVIANYKDNNKELNEDDECSCENCHYDTTIILKFIIFVFSFICLILILVFSISNIIDIISFIVIYLIMTILFMPLNFPFCYRNRKTFGAFGGNCCKKNKNNCFCTNIKYEDKSIHSHIVSITRLFSNLILFAVAFVLLFIFLFRDNTQIIQKNDFLLKGEKENSDTKKLLLPNMCYSSIYNVPLQLFLPFINDAYYYGNIKDDIINTQNKTQINSSLEINDYTKLFFDDDYEIKVIGNLIKKKDTVKMIQYNVKNKKNYVTILAIKGTTYNQDIYLDAQLYFSSILLSLLSTFSLSTQKDSLYFEFLEYCLNIPYRMFYRSLLVDEYMNNLKDAYAENEYKFYQNVVIVGHSLGGGLSKLFGRYIGKQAISLSGPGTKAFHYLWNYGLTSENSEISSIDLIPDLDLVPRVEVSGGTIYRIICKKGILSCHSKENSFCEVLIMCRNPAYKIYCRDFAKFGNFDIDTIVLSSQLNNYY